MDCEHANSNAKNDFSITLLKRLAYLRFRVGYRLEMFISFKRTIWERILKSWFTHRPA